MIVYGLSVPEENHEVIVIGTGLAGLAAAVAAREAGTEVLVIEKAPEPNKGGNTRFSGGGLRAVHSAYSQEEYYNELMMVTRGRANSVLTELMVRESADAIKWLTALGVEWAPPGERPDLRGHKIIHRGKAVPFNHNKGNGNGLIQIMVPITQRAGAKIVYETKAEELLTDRRRAVVGVRVLTKGGYRDLKAKAVILACGGFQANTEMRVRYIGRFADALTLRGTRYNTGDGLRMALEIGAQPAGQWGDFHSAVIDARSTKVECGETNINAFPYTVMVNKMGKRFVDEGETFSNVTYVRNGKLCLEQPDGIAFAIFDSRLKNSEIEFGMRSDMPPIGAPTIRGLAAELGIEPDSLQATIEAFNRAVQPGNFNPDVLDGKKAIGIEPPKSNWAMKIEVPPFYAFPITGGITFTFGGLKIDTDSRVIDTEDRPIQGLYAAGEIIGDMFYYNYPGGASLMRCTVFGRRAGRNAAADSGHR